MEKIIHILNYYHLIFLLLIFNDNFSQIFSPAFCQLHLIDKQRTEEHSSTFSFRELILDVWFPQESSLPCPVIIFSPGWSCSGIDYSLLLQQLACAGYIVCAVNHTYASISRFPDGRIIESLSFEQLKKLWHMTDDDAVWLKEQFIWMQDIRFVLDQLTEINQHIPILKRKLNTQAIGLCGHSFGGTAVSYMPFIDSRCKAFVNIDGPLWPENIFHGCCNAQSMFITAQHSFTNAQEQIDFIQTIKHYFLNNNYVFYISLPTDHDAFMNNSLPMIKITQELLVSFFDRFVKRRVNI